MKQKTKRNSKNKNNMVTISKKHELKFNNKINLVLSLISKGGLTYRYAKVLYTYKDKTIADIIIPINLFKTHKKQFIKDHMLSLVSQDCLKYLKKILKSKTIDYTIIRDIKIVIEKHDTSISEI